MILGSGHGQNLWPTDGIGYAKIPTTGRANPGSTSPPVISAAAVKTTSSHRRGGRLQYASPAPQPTLCGSRRGASLAPSPPLLPADHWARRPPRQGPARLKETLHAARRNSNCPHKAYIGGADRVGVAGNLETRFGRHHDTEPSQRDKLIQRSPNSHRATSMVEPGRRHSDKFPPDQLAVRQVRRKELFGSRDLIDSCHTKILHLRRPRSNIFPSPIFSVIRARTIAATRPWRPKNSPCNRPPPVLEICIHKYTTGDTAPAGPLGASSVTAWG